MSRSRVVPLGGALQGARWRLWHRNGSRGAVLCGRLEGSVPAPCGAHRVPLRWEVSVPSGVGPLEPGGGLRVALVTGWRWHDVRALERAAERVAGAELECWEDPCRG